MQKQVSFTIQAPYFFMGELTENTRHIWVACHGHGQLARYFMKRFDFLDLQEHYLIAPQGPDRFYMDNYTRIGASWTTRENREMHIENQLNYLDSVFDTETADVDWSQVKLHLLGFSQGVSAITRWAASRKILFDSLSLWAGGFPPELTKDQWSFVKSSARTFAIIGRQDEYLTEERLEEQKKLISGVFENCEFILFEGKHEMNREVLATLVEKIS
ncbi:MAG: esterase [Bacteroidia bacterium]